MEGQDEARHTMEAESRLNLTPPDRRRGDRWKNRQRTRRSEAEREHGNVIPHQGL